MNGRPESQPQFLFQVLSEDQVWAYLDGPIADNLVAQEVARLVAEYAIRFGEVGRNPVSHRPIDKVALKLAENYR